MNNAAYWAAVEQQWGDRFGVPRHVVLEYRRPIDENEAVVIAQSGDILWLTVAGEVRAAAALA